VRFSQKRQDGFAPNFFSGFKRKQFFITISIEKEELKKKCNALGL